MEVGGVLYPLAVLAIVAIWIVQLAIALRRPPGRIDIVGALRWRPGWAILVIGFIGVWIFTMWMVDYISD